MKSAAHITFVLYTVVYVAGVAHAFWPTPDFLYLAKHTLLLAPAFFFVTTLNYNNLTKIVSLLFFAATSLFFIFYNFQLLYAAQAILFAGAVTFWARYLEFSYKLFLVCLALICVTMLLDLLLQQGEFIYTAYYGRPRLQLGFSHPKEAGNFIIVTVLIYLLARTDLATRSFLSAHTLMSISIIVLLFFVQSRNALLTISIFLIFNFVAVNAGTKGIYALICTLTIPIVVFFAVNWEMLSKLSSGRLNWWLEILSSSQQSLGTHSLGYDVNRATFDNYYLNMAFLLSPTFLLILIVFLAFILRFAERYPFGKRIAVPLVFAQMFNSLWDSGMFSTGSLLNLVVWTLIIKTMSGKFHGQKAIS